MKIPVSLAVVCIAAAATVSARPRAQSTAAFEVVSVKRNVAGGPVTAFPAGRGFTVQNFTGRALVELAFGLPEYRLAGGPEWASTERFDVSARTAADVPYPEMLLMLRGALAQRFQLVTRIESREQSRYALVLDRDDRRLGPGLRAATTECLALQFPKDGPPPPPPPPGGPRANDCPSMFGPGFMSARKVEIPRIVEYLSREPNVRRAVVDKTGLTGTYNADASWNFEMGPGAAGAPVFRFNPDGPTLFTALREQLGLRLQPERGPVDVLVIEKMERPTED